MAKRAVLAITGMKNNACRERVAEALMRVPGARDVSVSLIRARAEVVYEPPCDVEELVRAVTRVGYMAAPAAVRDRG